MKWNGETPEQWKERTHQWHRHFCWTPQQMIEGHWVWLAPVWARRQSTINNGFQWVFTDAADPPKDPLPPKRPPPSATKK